MSEAAEWRRSSFCSETACIEIRLDQHGVCLRSTNRPEIVIELTTAEWEAFKKAVLNGEF